MRYELLTNVAWTEAGLHTMFSGYTPGDLVVASYSGDVDAADGLEGAAEHVYVTHNRDDRPTGQVCPSMSVGDLVVFDTPDGPVAYACQSEGWTQTPVPDEDRIVRDRAWSQITADVR